MSAPPQAQGDDGLRSLLERRHSCRAFDGRPVSRETIAAITALAGRTVSWCNSQPWHLVVGDVAATERLRCALMLDAAAEAGSREIAPEPSYQGVSLERRRRSGYALYASLGIAKGDRDAADRQRARNFALFDAPNVAVLTCDRALGPYGLIDCGGFLSVFLLAAESLGIAAIALASIAGYPRTIRRVFAIGEERVVVCGIALGHPAGDPVNRFRTERAGVDEILDWQT